jgi:hypothetical protein
VDSRSAAPVRSVEVKIMALFRKATSAEKLAEVLKLLPDMETSTLISSNRAEIARVRLEELYDRLKAEMREDDIVICGSYAYAKVGRETYYEWKYRGVSKREVVGPPYADYVLVRFNLLYDDKAEVS